MGLTDSARMPWFIKLFVICFFGANAAQPEFKLATRWSADGFKLFPDLPIAYPSSNDTKCREDSLLIMQGLEDGVEWAERMWDASAHDTPGVFYGNLEHFGSFDECADIDGPVDTQYCLVVERIRIKSNAEGLSPILKYISETSQNFSRKYHRNAVTVGKCLPESCSERSITDNMNEYLNDLENSTIYGKYIPSLFTYDSYILPNTCKKFHSDGWQTKEIVFWVFCLMIVALSIFCFAIETYTLKLENTNRFVSSFSLKKNAVDLFTVGPERSFLGILHGMKFISCLIVYYGHAFLIQRVVSTSKELNERTNNSWGFMVTLSTDLMCDTFFTITGLLLTYSMLRSQKRGHSVTWAMAVGRRLVRILPILYIMIWFICAAYDYLGWGPRWIPRGRNCKKNWWVTMLLLMNYVRKEEKCYNESWYITVDIHLCLIGTLLLVLMEKREKIGLFLIFLFAVLGLIAPGVLTYYHDLKSFAIDDDRGFLLSDTSIEFNMRYIVTHYRCAPFFIGMLAGFFFVKSQNIPTEAKWPQPLILVILFFILLCLQVFATKVTFIGEIKNRIFIAIFVALRRPVWSIGIICLIIAHRGYPTRLVNFLLASKFPTFMSRILLPFYLAHMRYMYAVYYSSPRQPDESVFLHNRVLAGIANVVVVTIISIALTLFIDYPCRNLFNNFVVSTNSKKETDKKNGNIASSHV